MRQSLPAPVNLRRQSHNALIGALTGVVFIAAGTFGPAANRIALIMIGRANKVVTPSERVCYFGKTYLLEGNSSSCTLVIESLCGLACRLGSFLRASLRVFGSSGSDNNVALFHRDHQIFRYTLFLCLFSFQLLLESNRSFFPRVPGDAGVQHHAKTCC